MKRFFRFAPFAALILLWGCGGEGTGDGAPVITSFTASSSSVAAGDQVTLSWVIDGGSPTSLTVDPEPGSVSGTSVDVFVDETTTYTLTASNASGTDTATTSVTVGGGGEGEPTGTFGVSTSASGPFINDTGGGITGPDDERVLSVPAGSTFYAQAVYSDPDGITSLVPYLANDNVDTELVPGLPPIYGFSTDTPTDCTLDGTATEVTCTFAITVAAGTPNITDVPAFEGEFAYVFKVNVTDAAGITTANSTRGYVIVTGGTDPTDPTTTTDPTDPTVTTDPTDPTTTTDPTDPTVTTDPTDPTTTTDPTDPTVTTDPTDPTTTTDPTDPEDDPTDPTTTDPTDPAELNTTAIHQLLGNAS